MKATGTRFVKLAMLSLLSVTALAACSTCPQTNVSQVIPFSHKSKLDREAMQGVTAHNERAAK